MRIELGKRYVTKSGFVIGPMEYYDEDFLSYGGKKWLIATGFVYTNTPIKERIKDDIVGEFTDTKEMIRVMQEYCNGAEIEFFNRGSEISNGIIKDPVWDWYNHEYRVVEKTKPSINWEHVSDEFNYLAIDSNEMAYFYTDEPLRNESCFYKKSRSEEQLTCQGFASFVRGTCDWKDSLIKRPEDNG